MTRLVDLTLSEQLKLTRREVDLRRRLLGLDEDDARTLRSVRDLVEERVEAIVRRFYDQQVQIDEIALIIGDADTLSRLRGSMSRYVRELFEGRWDEAYVQSRLRIGRVHQRIGLPPKLYLSSVARLEEAIMAELGPDLAPHPAEDRALRDALHRVLMFDTQLVIDTYINSLVARVDQARQELEAYTASLEETVAARTRQLEELTRRDALTGLLNQRAFYTDLRRELAVAERTGQPLSLVYIDLNGFKGVNDTQGHQAGDAALVDVAEALRAGTRDTDIACRYGGDEFCLVLPRTDAEQAERICRRVAASYATRRRHPVGLSMGIAQAGPGSWPSEAELVQRADHAMYGAKGASRQAPGHWLARHGATDPTFLPEPERARPTLVARR